MSLSMNISVTYTIKLIEKIEISYGLIYLLLEKKFKDTEKIS
jgi:hypothetical protein